MPLTYSNYKIWKVPTGGTFDLKNRPTTGYYLRSVTNGVIERRSVLIDPAAAGAAFPAGVASCHRLVA